MVVSAVVDDACEIIAAARPQAAVYLTCEHASDRLPAPWSWSRADLDLVGTHWAVDRGAAELCRSLAHRLGAGAVLARFTRLLVDANRAEDSPGLLLTRAGGRLVELNRAVDERERHRRIRGYWRPYHHAVDTHVAASSAPVVLAIHSFSPVWDGQRREFDLGVLFDRDQALAEGLAAHLGQQGWTVRLNEPYSGKRGLIYSVDRHARQHQRQGIELEVRQDRAMDGEFRAELVHGLERFGWSAHAG
jgi:predicted N-formylglutamate amidohydrolase